MGIGPERASGLKYKGLTFLKTSRKKYVRRRFSSILGYLRNFCKRLLSSEKFSEVFTLWVFPLKPFPGNQNFFRGGAGGLN